MSVDEFRLKPNGAISRIAIAMETGIVITEISVPRQLPRNSSTARPQSMIATASSSPVFLKRMLTKWALS